MVYNILEDWLYLWLIMRKFLTNTFRFNCRFRFSTELDSHPKPEEIQTSTLYSDLVHRKLLQIYGPDTKKWKLLII